MTSRVGRRNRKRVPEPRLDSEATFKMPSIVCPFCNNHFEVDKLIGEIGQRVCPFCEEEITPEYYDSCAPDVFNEKIELETEKKALRSRISALENKCNQYRSWWQRPIMCFYKLKLKRAHRVLDPQMKRLKNRIKSRKQKLNCLARNSYYVSEWFLNTHFLLETNGEKLINANYNRDCQFELWCSNKFIDAGGFIGEYKVFNIYLEECLDDRSPLFGSRLIPNIYVPRSNKGEFENSFWAQIDLILLTKSCAFVVEVKNWRTDVYVDLDSGDIFTTSKRNSLDGSFMFHDETYYLSRLSLDQNSNHASWFYDNFKGYPFDRIFEMTLFFNPKSFEATSKYFLNNRFACSVNNENSEALRVMVEASSNLNKIFDKEHVDQMADKILNKFGDLNQKRARIHKNKVERLNRLISEEQGG